MIKFDCAKVSGKLDYVRVTDRMSKGLKATISLDGQKIPNIQMETEFYEELNEGDDVTLYAIVKNSKMKEKNFGVLYGFENSNGVRSFATKYRWQVPFHLSFYAMIAFAVVFVLGWFANVYVGRFLDITDVELSQITKLAVVEGGLAAAFFLHAAWRMVKCTADPQSWMVMEPAVLATRFSKLHK
ncbi:MULTISPECIES: hypothetical protein [Pseudomonas]|uniref:hypothetical protein n=1 Tax=Pseudomonas TaxID=286 RepID=UPI000D87C58B|nr:MULTISPECIES: hypothetical protein [Pseudomonas]MDD2079554.1 hypothetical protein [Pseudomonas putida]PXZ50284.1 hypothetical protein DM483_11495 [Pseudomonas sp. SMT-1]QDW57478.1 hypothetical protein FFH79_011645 [Pseudomonas sp. KBS0802]QXZ06325.1 hypothetical protein HG554_19235 [Pseudomonas putida]UUX22693.1 hypothetical protein M8Z99_19285 [Pseudomonas putida]